MICAEVLAALPAQHDGELPAAAAAEIAAHLAQCPACRLQGEQEAALAGWIARALRAPVDPTADEVAWARALAQAIPADPAPRVQSSWWRRLHQQPSARQLRWMALAASLALLATFSMAGLGLRRALHLGEVPVATAPSTTPGAAR